jgi:hypothetical protein
MNNTDKDISLLMEKTSRRRALKNLGFGALAVTAARMGMNAAASDVNPLGLPPTSIEPVTLQLLDLALNLEYLEANFYSYATTGADIASQGVIVTGHANTTPGAITVPDTTLVSFSNPNVQAYALEIAADELAHVNFLRSLIMSTGNVPVAQPAIDLVNSFNTASSAAGLGPSFSPFTSSAGDLDFLLGSYIFEDVGVTAYHGALTIIQNKDVLTGAAGILGTEAYHAATVRNEIYKLGSDGIAAVAAISNARNTLGGEGLDQGVQVAGVSNLVPADGNALTFARTLRLVLNIVYLGVNATKGGFFPNGISTR